MELQETVDDSRIALNVGVEDSEGNMLADGKTNEMLQVSFDVEEGQEYFVSLVAGEGQKGTYRFGLELTPEPQLPATDVIDSEVVEDDLDCEVTEPAVVDSDVVDSDVVDSDVVDSDVVDSDVVDSNVVDSPNVEPGVVDSGDEMAVSDTTDAGALPVGNGLADDCETVVDEATDLEPIPKRRRF